MGIQGHQRQRHRPRLHRHRHEHGLARQPDEIAADSGTNSGWQVGQAGGL